MRGVRDIVPRSFGGAASTSPVMHALFDKLRDLAPLDEPVLLRGEYASGRETLARAMHDAARPGTPFIVVDLASIPIALIESTLFGLESGSFTGAHVIRRGPFEDAERGTVVLREIGTLPWDLQPKVMRLLETRQFRRVGSNHMRPFNGRVVATTHTALDELSFRHDLRAMLSHQLEVPPLRERIADLPLLLAEAGRELDADLIARLSRLAWRGNFADWKASVAVACEDVTERELLQTIEEDPDDDGARLVYADALEARADLRGELIHLQVRLAQREDHKLRAAEKKLLQTHGKTFAAPVIATAMTPVHAPVVTFERGFVSAIALEGEALRKLDVITHAAPLLTRVIAHGFLESASWTSPALRRLRAIEVTIQTLGETAVVALAGCRYLTGLRSLTLSAGTTPVPDDAELRQLGVTALAMSPHLAGVTELSLDGYRLDAVNLATLLGDAARWRLATLRVSRLDHESRETLAGSQVLTGTTIYVDNQVLR